MIAPALRTLAVAALAGLLTCSSALAADGEATPLGLDGAGEAAGGGASPGAGGGDLVRTIVGLAIVLAVIYGLHWVLKQLRASKAEASSGTALESLASLPLGGNRALHLVQAGDELVLLGVGDHGVTPIRTYRAAEARALGLLGDELIVEAELVGLPAGGTVSARGRGNLLTELRRRTVR